MRILIAADIFSPQSGGPATYAVTLANELTKQGVGVAIVSLNPQSDISVVSCSLYRVSWKNKFRYLQYLWLLFKYAKAADVVYAMGPVNAGLPALIACRLRRKKFVVKVVGDYAWEQGTQRFRVNDTIDDFQKKKHYFLRVQFLKWLQSFVAKKADTVIVPSNYLKNMVAGWGVNPAKVQLIFNSVEFKTVMPTVKPNEERWLVSVGRLVPWKGMVALIEVMPSLLEQFTNLKLKIIGEGPEAGNLRLKIVSLREIPSQEGKDLRLSDCVELLGNLPHDKALSYIGAADVFILNSGYEGLSHVILEAMNFGVPILASKVGGNPETLSEGYPGDLFNYNDKNEIKKMISDYLLANLTERKGLDENFKQQFGFATMIKRTKEALEKV